MLQPPPLSLYVHFPWCVAKCPYCDFNSHALNGELPESLYVEALLADLELELPRVWGRPVHSVFLGGGTPSLFSASAMDRLLSGFRARLALSPTAEITMEANPGAVEHDRFEDYRAAGINRISLGIQSFNNRHLQSLGRIHGGRESGAAIDAMRKAGFNNFNLDLMWGLPDQTPDEAVADIQQALSYEPSHLSHYHLTIEPNTVFAARPPILPDEDSAWDMEEACAKRLSAAGFEQYEISAWARPGRMSQHNLNYWRFGDYIGIGAGAHGKITLPAEDRIIRTRRKSHPRPYLKAMDDLSFIAEQTDVAAEDRIFEFFLNRLRLQQDFTLADFSRRTGLDPTAIGDRLKQAIELEFVETVGQRYWVSNTGRRFLNDLQALFLRDH